MGHIFLLSDVGTEGTSVVKMKGILLSHHSAASFIDISHDIREYEVNDAALLLKDIFHSLPSSSIVISYVSCYYDDPAEYILVSVGTKYFLAPDNGVLSFMVEGKDYEVFLLGNSDYGNWPGKLFAEAAGKLAEGIEASEIGVPHQGLRKFISLQPIVNEKSIRATIMKVDRFGNLILNVDKETFEIARNQRRFSLHYQHNMPITFISNQYADVEIGDVLARFNSDGYLEVAVNQSSALDELSLKKNDLIQIDFY